MNSIKRTTVKITATVEDLMKEGVSRYYAEKIQNTEGVIIKKAFKNTFCIEIDEMRWSLERKHFRILERNDQ